MYSPLAFKWQIELDENGRYLGVTPLSDGTKKNRGLSLLAPNMKRSGTKAPPLLLADNAKYVLGFGSDHPADSRQFQEFKTLVERCWEQTGESVVGAVARFLQEHQLNPIQPDTPIEGADNVLFRVESVRPFDLPSVRKFWVSCNAPDNDVSMQCIVCGKTGPVDRVSPIAIKGIPGGQPMGMALVSANKNAFESYGAEQAYIAPTCRSCGEAYANAINTMIRSEYHHLTVGPSVFLFWTVGGDSIDIPLALGQPKPEQVRELIASYRKGREHSALDVSAFYALSLTASSSRVVVRDWLDTTVPNVEADLARLFDLHRIIQIDGSNSRPYGVYALAASLYLKPNDQMVANIPRLLVRCALSGGPLPDYVLAQAVARNRAEQGITSPRAALIKAVLLSQMDSYEEGYMERLETKCKSPAYLCGRLLSVVEVAQKLAVKPKSTLVDRFYGSVSSAPASVFGTLLRDFQMAHMSKLRKDRPGLYFALDSQAQDILEQLEEFPASLDAKGQALFALGYYHQKADNRAQAKAKAELKALAAQEDEDE
jgi:CRISPR-associated protein Csd1